MDLGVRQVSPQVAEQPVAVRPSGIKAFSAKDPVLIVVLPGRRINVINKPIARSKARPWAVAHVWVNCRAGARRTIYPRSADGGRTLYPNPLAASISPEIAQRTIACGVLPLSAKQPEISNGVGPSGGTPPRTGNICGRNDALGSIDSGLIDDVSAALPGPLAPTELPQVVQRGWAARGIEIESTEKPEIACGIGPMGAWGPRGMVNRDLSLAETRAAGRFKVRRCPRMHEAAHKLNG